MLLCIINQSLNQNELIMMFGFFFSELLSQMPEDNPIIEMKVKDGNCALCQYAMNTLYQLLENKDTEDEIKNALETVCR